MSPVSTTIRRAQAFLEVAASGITGSQLGIWKHGVTTEFSLCFNSYSALNWIEVNNENQDPGNFGPKGENQKEELDSQS